MNQQRRGLSVLGLSALAISGMPSAVRGAFAASPPALPAGARGRIARFLPNVEFTTQHGRRARFYTDLIKGRKVLINFMYTECSETCPRTTANLVRVQNVFGARMGRDVFILSITLTPERDTPQRLKAYAAEQGCRSGWYFLNGRDDDVTRVRRSLGVYDAPEISQHLGILTYGNEPEGKWGATYTLAPADQIVWSVKNRIDPWVARPWP